MSPVEQMTGCLLSEVDHLARGHITQSSRAAVNRSSLCQVFRDFAGAYVDCIIVLIPDLCSQGDNWVKEKKEVLDALTADDFSSIHYARDVLGVV